MKFIDFAGNKIRSIRKRKKIRTAELAKACGVSESEMRHLENGTRIITDAQIEKAAECLHVSPAALRSRNIENYTDVMHLLFELVTHTGIQPVITEEGTFIKIVEPALVSSIKAWIEVRDKLHNDEISAKEWLAWEDDFPYSMENHPPIRPYREPLPSPESIIGVDLCIREMTPEESMAMFEGFEDTVFDDDNDDD